MRERACHGGVLLAGAAWVASLLFTGGAAAQGESDADLAERIAQRISVADQREQQVAEAEAAPVAADPVSVGGVTLDPSTGRVVAGDPAGAVRDDLVVPEPAPREEELLPLGRSPGESVAAANNSAEMPKLGGGWLLNTMAALGVVIGLILGLRWLAKRSGAVGAAVATSAAVEVLSRTTIAPRNHIVLLRVGPRVLVVNDSGQGMRTLANIDDPDEVAELLRSVQMQRQDSSSRSFTGMMARLSGSGSDAEEQMLAQSDPEASVDHVRDTLAGLRGRLSALAGSGRGGDA